MSRVRCKIESEYIDHGMGFPVMLRNVPMLWIQGDWVPDIDYNRLHATTALSLALKPTRLTGAEVKFLRLFCEMTYQKFADLFAVAPQAVMKWEKMGRRPTRMAWTTEKDLRLTVLDRLGVAEDQFLKTFRALRRNPSQQTKQNPILVDIKRTPNPRRMLASFLRQQSSRP